MYRLIRHWKTHNDVHYKSWAAHINAAQRYASTRAAAAEDKTSVEQLQQIFDDEKKSGGIVSVACSLRLAFIEPNNIILHHVGSCFQKGFVVRQPNSH